MQLDQTHVAIRVRTLSEIGDLSLLMIRRYPIAFFHAFVLGATVWMAINAALLSWLPWQIVSDTSMDEETFIDLMRYFVWMTVLVSVQVPIAGVFATYYLGQAVFEQRPTLRRTLAEVRQQAWPLIWTLGIIRMAIPVIIFVAWRWQQPTNAGWDFVFPIGLMLYVAMVRSNRPFLTEMIVLEKCPLRGSNENTISLKRRSRALHRPMSGELASRFLMVAVVLAVLVASVYYTLVWGWGIAFNQWSVSRLSLIVFYPLSLWMVGSLSVIVRLLGYLDTRIRLEGWEVELAIRAEAIRQFGEDAMEDAIDEPIVISGGAV